MGELRVDDRAVELFLDLAADAGTQFFAMKDYKVMFKATILGTLGMWIAATLIEWSGVNGIVSIPGLQGKDIDFIVPLLLQKSLSPVISSLLITGIMAAGMSTIDSLLISATGAITRDIIRGASIRRRPTARFCACRATSR